MANLLSERGEIQFQNSLSYVSSGTSDGKGVAFTQRELNETVSTNPAPVGKLTSIKHVCRIN